MSTNEFAYAGFWVRAAARIVDILVIVGIYNVFYLVDRFGASTGMWPPSGFEDIYEVGRFSPENVVRGVFFLGFPVFYYVYMHGAFGQTFGKMALKIRVVNEDGSPLDYRRAFFRWLGYFLCVFTLYVGYVWAAFDRRKQGFHDRVCGTLVVYTSNPQGRRAEPAPDELQDGSGLPTDPSGSAGTSPASPA